MSNARSKAIPADHPAAVELRVLGGFAVLADGQALPERAWGGSRKARALAKLLALAPGQRLHRDQALDALWPDLDPEAAGPSLHQAIYLVRRALAPLGIEVGLQAQIVALRARGTLTTDLAAFDAATARARRSRDRADYEAALARYTGDLLPDDRYEEWAVQPRATARAAYLDLLREFATAPPGHRLCRAKSGALPRAGRPRQTGVGLQHPGTGGALSGRQRALDSLPGGSARPLARGRQRAWHHRRLDRRGVPPARAHPAGPPDPACEIPSLCCFQVRASNRIGNGYRWRSRHAREGRHR